MSAQLKFSNGRNAWRWLVLALLLASIVPHNFTEPRSIFRIEEVLADNRSSISSTKRAQFAYSNELSRTRSQFRNAKRLQYKHYQFLSYKLHIEVALAIFSAPEISAVLIHTTGQFLHSRTSNSPEYAIFYY